MLVTDENQLYEILEEPECRQLLSAAGVGHVAFTQAALPAIQPVRYVVHGGSVAFRVRAGSPMAAVLDGSVVAFEVGSCGPDEWWSVTVVGRAHLVSDPWDAASLGALTGRRPSPDDSFVTVGLDMLRGWRSVLPDHRATG